LARVVGGLVLVVPVLFGGTGARTVRDVVVRACPLVEVTRLCGCPLVRRVVVGAVGGGRVVVESGGRVVAGRYAASVAGLVFGVAAFCAAVVASFAGAWTTDLPLVRAASVTLCERLVGPSR
jgi:hypothetical protein